ncbi:hypothetical protein [Nonomuraea lactucae]|uniref:hypothetical protein n=1 Tax=Nonomuraea lactucae TaxID=2249762 RepID=UPI0013B3B32B|nr:hypothetical protein [Nonomuraea lactucae]
MRLGASSTAVAALLVCFAVLTGCSGKSERPTLAEATRQLVSDGDALVSMMETDLTGLTKERADKDRTTSCTPGEVQRYFVAKGNFADPAKQDPLSRIGLLKGKLETMGYREAVDELDLLEDELGVTVALHEEAKLTFVLLGRLSETPNLVIIGKTECYPRTG